MLSLNATVPLSVDFDRPEDYFIFLFHIIFATSAVLLAGTVTVAISTTKSLRRQNRFIFMLNTSISDTLVGFSVYYLGLFDVYEGFPPRNGTYHVLPSLLGINIITFFFAQFDRYVAICYPFFYDRYITQPVAIGACVYSWVHTYSILLARNVVPVSIAIRLGSFGIMAVLAVIIIQILMTIKLYVIARYQLGRDPPSAEKENRKESLIIIIFVVITFLTLWSPSFINVIMKQQSFHGLNFRNEATNLFAIMGRFSALTTPAVYVWGSPALREAVKKSVLGRVCSKRKRR